MDDMRIKALLASVPLYAQNQYIDRCPNCGALFKIDGEFLREDVRSGVKYIERLLYCPTCKVRIRQYIYIVR